MNRSKPKRHNTSPVIKPHADGFVGKLAHPRGYLERTLLPGRYLSVAPQPERTLTPCLGLPHTQPWKGTAVPKFLLLGLFYFFFFFLFINNGKAPNLPLRLQCKGRAGSERGDLC